MSDIMTLVRSLTGARSHWADRTERSLCGRLRSASATMPGEHNDLCTRCAIAMRRISWGDEVEAHRMNGPSAGQIWECVDLVGRTGEQVRVTAVLEPTLTENKTVTFVVARAAKSFEAELGSDGSMESDEFTQRYKYVR